MPAGFFFSILMPYQTEPNGTIALTFLGGIILAATVLTLGIGLVRTPVTPPGELVDAREREVLHTRR